MSGFKNKIVIFLCFNNEMLAPKLNKIPACQSFCYYLYKKVNATDTLSPNFHMLSLWLWTFKKETLEHHIPLLHTRYTRQTRQNSPTHVLTDPFERMRRHKHPNTCKRASVPRAARLFPVHHMHTQVHSIQASVPLHPCSAGWVGVVVDDVWLGSFPAM